MSQTRVVQLKFLVVATFERESVSQDLLTTLQLCQLQVALKGVVVVETHLLRVPAFLLLFAQDFELSKGEFDCGGNTFVLSRKGSG